MNKKLIIEKMSVFRGFFSVLCPTKGLNKKMLWKMLGLELQRSWNLFKPVNIFILNILFHFLKLYSIHFWNYPINGWCSQLPFRCPERSPPGQFPPSEFPPIKFPPPPSVSCPQLNYHQAKCSPPVNFPQVNSHLDQG